MKHLVTVIALFLVGSLSAASPVLAAEPEKFDLDSVSAEISTHQAGAHPDLTVGFDVTTNPTTPADQFGTHSPYASVRNARVDLPPGLLGNLNAVTACSVAQFVTTTVSEGCPFSSQVGIANTRVRGIRRTVPLYNLDTSGDEVARLGFYVLAVPTFVSVHIRSDRQDDYGISSQASDIFNGGQFVGSTFTLWGVPAASSHDRLRITQHEATQGATESPPRSFGRAAEPFLTNPTTCGGDLKVKFAVDSYEEEGVWREKSASLGAITGCPEIDFDPSFSLLPTNREAAAASGADATLTIPQNEAVNGLATSQLRDTVVRLPKGVAISPGAAEGLEACSESQVGFGKTEPAHCPEGSKIATAEIDSPALSRPVQGAVYQRTPEPGHLTRAWLVADELGVHVKLPGEFQLDPQSGQITSLFLETPQVPVRQFKLHFKGGPHGVLMTPNACGTYQTEYSLTPWSGNADAVGTTPMTFDQNCGVGGFNPRLTAGMVNPSAGKFSALVTELVAASGEQNLAGLSVTLPPGVLAKLAGVPLCPDAAAGTGDCPAGSQIGTTTVASGPGSSPLWIPQPGKDPTAVYLAGPYKGGPYSIVVKTPAQAGPFDLGDVVVRVALQVNPGTTQVTAVSDPLPQILEGIPIAYRTVNIDINRPQFALNPTSCEAMQVLGTASSAAGATANLVDRFQVGDCAKLGFEPKLRIRLKGKTNRSGHPAVSATLKMPSGGANVKRVRVLLPRSEQIDNAHINNPCTRVQFNRDACPPKSVLGRARADTPLLDQPLEGPVYFRSNGGERELPDIVADLRGPIHVVLVGFIDSKNGRIRNTFASVPDAPVSEFRLNLFGGRRGLLVNNRNLCKSVNKALVTIDGQNGRVADSSLAISRCRGKGHPSGSNRRGP